MADVRAFRSHGWLLLLLLAGPRLALGTAPATQPFAAIVQSDDLPASIQALRQVATTGSVPDGLKRALPALLVSDGNAIEVAAAQAPGTLDRLHADEREIEASRSAQLEAVKNLTSDPTALREVRHNYDQLSEIQDRLAPMYADQIRVLRALDRRALCLKLLSEPPADDSHFDRLVAQALGMPTGSARALETGALKPPLQPERRGLWFFISCRRIEGWNRTVEPYLNDAEIAHGRVLNRYRELLGWLPYEWDLRLTQSARRHSREMIDLWYFSHYSPTPAQCDPFARMAQAGYKLGIGENIHMGKWDGQDAFWSLFNSPSHHRTWIEPKMTAVGIGKWENAWTEDFGSGPRLMSEHPSQRAREMILGEILKPQAVEARNKPRDLRGIKFYDEHGQEITTGVPPGIVETTVKAP